MSVTVVMQCYHIHTHILRNSLTIDGNKGGNGWQVGDLGMGGRYRAIDRYLLPTGLTAANLPQWVCCCGMNGPTNARKMHRPCSLSRRTVLIFTARCYASAVLAMALCPSVRPPQVGVLLKRLNVGSHKQHHTIPQGI